MKKRSSVVSLLLAVAIVFSSISPIFAKEEFKDMPTGWSKLYMEAAVENGILKGFEGKIRPTDNITRAELATILSRVLNLKEKADLGNYKDAYENQWYYEDLAKAVKSGIIKGRSSTIIDPTGLLTREEAFTMIARVFMLEEEYENLDNFVDADKISDWAKPSMNAMIFNYYVEGDENNRLNPQREITREEIAAIIYRMIEVYADENIEGKEIDGNVVINGDVTKISNSRIDGDLIISEGASLDNIEINNVKLFGRLIVRGNTDVDFLNNSHLFEIHSLSELIKLRISDSSIEEIGKNVEVEYLDKDKDEEKPEDKDEEKPEDKDEEKPGETPEAPLPELPAKPEQGEPVTKEVVKEGERFDLATGFEEAVWVEVEKDGKVVGTGGMTEADGVAKLNLTKSGDYTVVVKDKEDGEVLKEIPLTMIPKQGDPVTEVVVDEGERFDLATGFDKAVWVEVEEDGEVVGTGGMTEADGVAKLNLTKSGDYTVVVKDKEDGEVLKEISLTMVEKLEVTKVTAVKDITVVTGEEVKLPETVKVTLSDDTKKDVKVEWNTEDIDFNEVKTHEVIGTIVLDEDAEFTISDELKKVTVKVAVEAEALELQSSELNGEDLQLTFNRELTEEELGNVVKDYLRFQMAQVYRENEKVIRISEESNQKGKSQAKDLTMDEVSAVLDSGFGGSKINWEKLKVTQENKVVTISIDEDLITHDDLTNQDKIGSGNAIKDAGYKITVHVKDKPATGGKYKIQLNAIGDDKDNKVVKGKFILETK